MDLIIVESPSKAKTISNFLDKNYEVIASLGHILDLPKTGLGITINEDKKNFSAEYKITSDHKEVFKQIEQKAKKAKTIYLATDEDREGESIAYHIAKALGKDELKLPRIVFHEITKTAILNALKNPRTLDMKSVEAQLARRLLDRLVGFKLSPLLRQKVQTGLSAGRVQSAALKIIVERENEIKAFVSEDYFEFETIFKNGLEASLYELDGKKVEKLSLKDEAKTNEIYQKLLKSSFVVSSIEQSDKSVSAQPPFMTSTLQQLASSMLGYSPKKTMQIAQKLYEGLNTPKGVMGLITYMRTDSLNIAKEAQADALKYIKNNFGDEYAPSKPNVYKSKNKSAQEAHEAIRPSDIELSPSVLKGYLKADELKLYELIYNRFLASQMANAKTKNQSVYIKTDFATFKLSGKKIVFDGFYKVWKNSDKEVFFDLKEGQKMELESLNYERKQTQPPSRYTQASLIKQLESLGIGRPSTYASTVSLLTDRNYVLSDKNTLIPEESAFLIVNYLEDNFKDIVDLHFSAKLEEDLDKIASGEYDYQDALWDFYEPFLQNINIAKEKKSEKKLVSTGETCPLCSGELVIRKGKFGEFVGCGNYPKCKYIKQDKEQKPQSVGESCPECGSELISRRGRYGEFVGCSAYPKCKFIKKADKKAEPQALEIKCPECSKPLVKRMGKRGAFYGCSGYPKCNFISNYEPVGKCECGGVLFKKELKKGTFIECKECKKKEELKD